MFELGKVNGLGLGAGVVRSDGAGEVGDNGFGQSADVDDNVFVVPAESLLVWRKSTKSIRLGAPYVINSLPKKLIELKLVKRNF